MTWLRTDWLPTLTAVLSLLTIALVVLGHLALTDIVKGEADVRLEWAVLRGAAVIEVALALAALALLRRRSAPRRDADAPR